MIFKTAFLFPGQGSQHAGMGQDLARDFAVYRDTFREASDVLGFDMAKLCFEGSEAELRNTVNTQPAVLTCSIAAFRLLRTETGLQPDYLAGHSLGEYSALVASGSLLFEDALRAVRLRGGAMQEAVADGAGAMLAVTGVPEYLLAYWCSAVSSGTNLVSISGINSAAQLTVSGSREAVDTVREKVQEYGGQAVSLKVSAPFHCALMKPAADQLLAHLGQVNFRPQQVPVISNVTALPYNDPADSAALLAEQVTAPVQWQKTILYFEEQGVRRMVELGPGKVLRNLLRGRNWLDVKGAGNRSDWEQLREHWMLRAPSLLDRTLGLIVSAPNRNTSAEAYNTGVIARYRKMEALKKELAEAQRKLQPEEEIYVLENFLHILRAKQLSEQEIKMRLGQLINETGCHHLNAKAEQLAS